MLLRNKVVRLFGLKDLGGLGGFDASKPASAYLPGERVETSRSASHFFWQPYLTQPTNKSRMSFKEREHNSQSSAFGQAKKPLEHKTPVPTFGQPEHNSTSPPHRLLQHLKNPRCLALRHIEAHKRRSRLAQAEHVSGGEHDAIVQCFS